jgi:hypothetical protein
MLYGFSSLITNSVIAKHNNVITIPIAEKQACTAGLLGPVNCSIYWFFVRRVHGAQIAQP